MKQGNILIWDLPTRILHWLLTAGFMAAGLIAFLTDKESSLFPYHAVIGLALALLVVLRVIWGFVGTRKDCEPSYAIASASRIAAAMFLGLLGEGFDALDLLVGFLQIPHGADFVGVVE